MEPHKLIRFSTTQTYSRCLDFVPDLIHLETFLRRKCRESSPRQLGQSDHLTNEAVNLQVSDNIDTMRIPIPSFPPFFYPWCLASTSFGGMGLHLRRWVVAQRSSECLLAEDSRGFSQKSGKCHICAQSPVWPHYHPYHYPTEVTDVTIGARGLWLGTWTRAGGTVTLVWRFLAAAHGSMDSRTCKLVK